jgi:hypothetical protein
MTAEQAAAACFIQSIAKDLTDESKAILANRETALAAMARVANLDSASIEYPNAAKAINAAIINA